MSSVLSSAAYVLLRPRIFQLHLSTGPFQCFLPSSRDAYVCPLDSHRSALPPKSLPSLPPLSLKVSKHKPPTPNPLRDAISKSRALSFPVPSFPSPEDRILTLSSSLFSFLPSSTYSLPPAWESGVQGLPAVDDRLRDQPQNHWNKSVKAKR